ncbi:hypothetical protein PPERSA_11730 [Pseudocohnilembus persalinus]|uniref:Uncharacterized protein n=1 Tax=Pseudocohnilembus persalinus TaxID=266149 RepID=A0A0V0QGA3_PSEPJ|nr:hypothetical protein PPERSA_11730 [Pseudocohnilembus persalinus]|eukprot:KRX01283.1 hypothetical protein PPERSA_11730 [Pseudocohnilembus persalinus]
MSQKQEKNHYIVPKYGKNDSNVELKFFEQNKMNLEKNWYIFEKNRQYEYINEQISTSQVGQTQISNMKNPNDTQENRIKTPFIKKQNNFYDISQIKYKEPNSQYYDFLNYQFIKQENEQNDNYKQEQNKEFNRSQQNVSQTETNHKKKMPLLKQKQNISNFQTTKKKGQQNIQNPLLETINENKELSDQGYEEQQKQILTKKQEYKFQTLIKDQTDEYQQKLLKQRQFDQDIKIGKLNEFFSQKKEMLEQEKKQEIQEYFGDTLNFEPINETLQIQKNQENNVKQNEEINKEIDINGFKIKIVKKNQNPNIQKQIEEIQKDNENYWQKHSDVPAQIFQNLYLQEKIDKYEKKQNIYLQKQAYNDMAFQYSHQCEYKNEYNDIKNYNKYHMITLINQEKNRKLKQVNEFQQVQIDPLIQQQMYQTQQYPYQNFKDQKYDFPYYYQLGYSQY